MIDLTPERLAELRRNAEAVESADYGPLNVSPTVVVALLDEIERLRAVERAVTDLVVEVPERIFFNGQSVSTSEEVWSCSGENEILREVLERLGPMSAVAPRVICPGSGKVVRSDNPGRGVCPECTADVAVTRRGATVMHDRPTPEPAIGDPQPQMQKAGVVDASGRPLALEDRVRSVGCDIEGTITREPRQLDQWGADVFIEWDDSDSGWSAADTVERIPDRVTDLMAALEDSVAAAAKEARSRRAQPREESHEGS